MEDHKNKSTTEQRDFDDDYNSAEQKGEQIRSYEPIKAPDTKEKDNKSAEVRSEEAPSVPSTKDKQ